MNPPAVSLMRMLHQALGLIEDGEVVLGVLGFACFCWWGSGKVRYPSLVFLIIAALVALLMAAMR